MADNTDSLLVDPDVIARKIADHLRAAIPERDSELVYTPSGQHSYYRDLIRGGVGAEERLKQHREQMANMHAERARRQRALVAAGQEFRIEPSTTKGDGGYFSPPAWLNRLFATANRPGRVLAGLIPSLELPAGVSQINVPILLTGTTVGTGQSGESVPDADLTDGAARSVVEPIAGNADIDMQLFDLSPSGASADWAISMDLAESYDAILESRLLFGLGVEDGQIRGVMNVVGVNQIAYTDTTPTGGEIDTYLGQAAAQIGDLRLRPPECWLMRTSRWAWFQTSEDQQQRPFGLNTQFYLGADDDTPDPIGGLLGFPVFLDDAMSVTATDTAGAFNYTGGSQDAIICLRPTDMILFEGTPQTAVMLDPLSGTGGVRIQFRNFAAALTARRPAGISVIGGTGLTPITGF